MGTETPAVNAAGINKHFGAFHAVRDLDFQVRKGEIVSLLGPSGCGKTTMLRMLAGFVTPTSGTIAIAGKVVNGVPPHRRHVGMMFQSYALFPHMSVGENVAFGLRMRSVPKAEIKLRVEEALRAVRLADRIDSYPRQLSGGQQQRVALARALVIKPDVLLLDEPFGALDRELRQHLQAEMKRLQRQLGISTLLVTHDQEEVLLLSDRIAVMHKGRMDQIAAPEEIFERPATRFVAEFMGGTNIFEGRVEQQGGTGLFRIAGSGDAIGLLACGPFSQAAGAPVMIRPERVTLVANRDRGTPPAAAIMSGRVTEMNYLGSSTEYRVALDGDDEVEIVSRIPGLQASGERPRLDEPVFVCFDSAAVHSLPVSSQL
ncbi:ABC transporter ATP-binding protein [Methylobacterium tarhaniae]|uniref:ABC transporter ATP-binding protein n=1 Tax=Methylobacterium tarhaniae TaxID=1187852 RepID=UPI00069CBFB9|nr:ABC transporter ATP-binding protein [Methylobacterium tarhaniae]